MRIHGYAITHQNVLENLRRQLSEGLMDAESIFMGTQDTQSHSQALQRSFE